MTIPTGCNGIPKMVYFDPSLDINQKIVRTGIDDNL